MTLEDVVRQLLQCLDNDSDTTIPWEQVRQWPKGAVNTFQKAGWIKLTDLAETVECPGCEESCPMPVEVFPAQNGGPMRAFVACEDRNFGRVKIPLVRLQQWRLSQGQIAQWIATELGFHGKPEKNGVNGIYKLGTMQGKERLSLLELDTSGPLSLSSSGHSLLLMEVISVVNEQPHIDQETILTMVDLSPISTIKNEQIAKAPTRQPKDTDHKTGLEIGSLEWRQQNARNAANAKHNQPGGSRDKQQQIREIWATGKYSSRDRCAEEECAALDMSFSTARKALKNTPDP